MGLLDDAIREHLELKRRRGADAGEITRLESEALGPVRRSAEGVPELPDAVEPGEEQVDEPAAPSSPAASRPWHDEDEQTTVLRPGTPPGEPDAPAAYESPPPAPLPPRDHAAEPPPVPPQGPGDPVAEEPPLPVAPPGPGDPVAEEPPLPVAPPAPGDDPVADEPPLPLASPGSREPAAHEPPPRPRPPAPREPSREWLAEPEPEREPEPDPEARGREFTSEPPSLFSRLRGGRKHKRDPDPEPRAPGDREPPAAHGPVPDPYEPPPPPRLSYAPVPPPPVEYEPDIVPADDEPDGEDLLEETPEFLEETPEHDRLWFEQRPPRDFNFDD